MSGASAAEMRRLTMPQVKAGESTNSGRAFAPTESGKSLAEQSEQEVMPFQKTIFRYLFGIAAVASVFALRTWLIF